jgi:hypothetical protein
LLLYLCEALHLEVEVAMKVIDLVLDNVEHVGSRDRRAGGTRHPLWTARPLVPAVTDRPG